MGAFDYPKITDEQVLAKDFMNNGNDTLALQHLKELTFNQVTEEVTGGASESTVTKFVFVAPTKLKVVDVKFIRTAMNTGASNTPEVLLQQGETIIAQKVIPLTGALGDATAVTLVPDNVVVPAGTVLTVLVMTPASTVTTAVKGKVQFAWKSVV